MQEKPWNDYSNFIRNHFGQRVQKISVNTGLGCPNLDGKISRKGCTYCDNNSFSPFYCSPEKSVTQQLQEGIAFFSGKYKTQQYMAYFQSYTNTYTSYAHFKQLLEEALSVPGIKGLVIATRPDSISNEQIDLLNQLGKEIFISLEFGVESTIDNTLTLVNRGHDFACTKRIFDTCRNKNFYTGTHIIMGLPGENKKDILSHTGSINALRPNFLKLHQLQVLKNTTIAESYKQSPEKFVNFTKNEYIEMVANFLAKLDPEIILERFISESPPKMVIKPDWKGIKNFEFTEQLKKHMNTNMIWHGKEFRKHTIH